MAKLESISTGFNTPSRTVVPSERETELEALLPEYAKQLTRKGMSKARLYEQYHADYPDGYGLTMFKQALRQYLHQSKVVGHVEHYAGDQMYIDFAGDRLEVVDCMTGETKKSRGVRRDTAFQSLHLL